MQPSPGNRPGNLQKMEIKCFRIQLFHVTANALPVIEMWGYWCLTPLSTTFQLYRGGQFYWWRKPECLEKTIDISQFTLAHNVLSSMPRVRGIRTHNFSGDGN